MLRLNQSALTTSNVVLVMRLPKLLLPARLPLLPQLHPLPLRPQVPPKLNLALQPVPVPQPQPQLPNLETLLLP